MGRSARVQRISSSNTAPLMVQESRTLTLVVSGFPDVQEAMAAILLQADEVIVKPFKVKELAELIRKKTEEPRPARKRSKETVASILESDAPITIERWLSRVNQTEELTALPLSDQERTFHLPEIMNNIAERLRKTRVIEAIASPSPSAVAHGQLRFRQG